MTTPRLTRKDTGAIISDNVKSWTGWNAPWSMARITPLSGGAYLQKTASGVLQCQVTFRFATRFPDSTIDNMFKMLELARRDPEDGQGFLFRFRDLEGFTRDVQIWQPPGGGDLTSTQDFMEFWNPLHSYYAVPVDLMVPGYLP